jgi:hypothetical protein
VAVRFASASTVPSRPRPLPGQRPAAFEAKEVAFIADVQQVDLKKQTVTLRGAQRTVRLKIKDPEQLKLIKKGDQVEGVFAEADCRRGGTGTRQGEEIEPGVDIKRQLAGNPQD